MLVTLDVIAGIVFVFIGAVLGLYLIGTELQFSALQDGCTPGPHEGLVCNGTVLAIAVYGVIAVTIIAWFLGVGFLVVSFLRKRLGFVWPLGAIVLTISVFYLSTWVIGMAVPQA